MSSEDLQRAISQRLGIHADAAAWCTIDKIPQPPAEVLQAAGEPQLRPDRLRPLGLIGKTLAAVFMPILAVLFAISNAMDAFERLLAPTEEKQRLRAETERRKTITAEQRLGQVFDGDWNAEAGQFLLRWYTHSTHHQRLIVVTEDGIALAAPPRRASMGREKRMEIVARISAEEAALVDPFSGEPMTDVLLLRFRDGSWLRVESEEMPSDLHRHLLRQSNASRHDDSPAG